MSLPKSDYSQEVILDSWLNEMARLAASLQTVNVAGNANVTLASGQYQARVLEFTGALTGNIAVMVPADAGRAWEVFNNTSGSFSLTVRTSGGSGIAVPQGFRLGLYCDGTDVARLSPAVSGGNGLVAATVGANATQQHTVPTVTADTLALLAATQTLSGKTLSGVTLADATHITLNTATGSKIGTAAGQKLGFWNATPVAQPAHADQAAVTLGNTNGAVGGLTLGSSYSQSEVQALRDACETLADDVRALSTLVHALRTALVNTGLIKGAA